MALTYQTTLPDPNNLISDEGAPTGSSATAGPGYKSVKLISKTQTMKNKTNSGRLVTRSHGYHQWEIDIAYNPMTREEFEPLYNFILFRQGGLKPFYVSLPQYASPQDSTFATYVQSSSVYAFEATSAGSTKMWIDADDLTGASAGNPRPGDLFTISDSNDVNHQKAYMVSRVETNDAYSSTGPSVTQRVIHFTPALAKDVAENASIVFNNPKIKVILQGDVDEYSLGVEGLYQFSLKLEEVQ